MSMVVCVCVVACLSMSLMEEEERGGRWLGGQGAWGVCGQAGQAGKVSFSVSAPLTLSLHTAHCLSLSTTITPL